MDYTTIQTGELGVQLKAKEAEILTLTTPKDGAILSADVTKAGELDVECDAMRAELDKRVQAAAQAQTLHSKTKTATDARKHPVNILDAPKDTLVKFKDAIPYYHKLDVYAGREEEAYSDGLFILGALAKDEGVRNTLRQKGKEKYGHEYLALAEGVNSTGGYLVPTGFSNTVIVQQEQYGVARAHADVLAMPTPVYEVSRQRNGIANNVTAYWGGENVSMTDAALLWDQTELKAKKLYALAKYSNELGEDAIIDMADRIAKSAAIQLSYKEDQAWINGAGEATNGNVQGVIAGLAAASSLGVVTCASATTWATVTDADIMKALGTLPAFPGMQVKIFANRAAYYQIFRRLARAGGGNNITLLAGGGSMFEYDGIPVIETQVLPNATATNTVFCLIGDPKMSTMFGERRQMTVQLSDQAGTAFTDDQTWVKITERIDLNNFSLGDSTLAGGIVSLQTHS